MDEQLRLLKQHLTLAQQDFNYAEPRYIDQAIANLNTAEIELGMYRKEHGLSKET